MWSALDFKTFYLFHLSVISLTSIKALAAIQESRLCKLADIFSNACNQDLYGHFIPANWKLLNIKAAWCAPKGFLILVVPICVGYWSQSLLWCQRGCSGFSLCLLVGRVLSNHFNDEELDLGGELQRHSPNDALEIPWQEVCTISLTYFLNLNALNSHFELFWFFFSLCADAVAECGTRW